MKKITVAKFKEMRTGCSKTNLAESSKEGYNIKWAVLPVVKTISLAHQIMLFKEGSCE
jgi:hypothetical protein